MRGTLLPGTRYEAIAAAGVWATALLLVCAQALPGAPQIRITDGPPLTITGVVTGVADYQDYVVAPYLYLEGSGWYTKPTEAQPTVPINADGTFSASLASGGNDSLATIYYAALLPTGIGPPVGAFDNLPSIPFAVATASRELYPTTFSFAGRTWAAKGTYGPAGPKSNYFSAAGSDVWVDNAGMHLTVHNHDGRWWATEVILPEHLGYGTYTFKTKYNVNALDPNLTFGAFTWDPYGNDGRIPAWPNREIDFEDSRWGNAAATDNTQAVVQPSDTNKPHRYAIPDGDVTVTRSFTWQPGSIQFTTRLGDGSPSDYSAQDFPDLWTFTEDTQAGKLVPVPGAEMIHLNLWLNGSGTAPSNGQPAEVLITDFSYTRLPGPATLAWAGAVDGTWAVSPAANWSEGSTPREFRDGDLVTLGDAAGARPILLTGIVRPGSVVVNSSAVITLGGPGMIAGPCGLTKMGTGTLTIVTGNAYTGDTRIAAGTIVVAAGHALGSSAVKLGDATSPGDASLLICGAFEVDRPIAVVDDGSPSSARILGGTNTGGTAIFSGDVAVGKDLTLAAAPGGVVEFTGGLDDSAGHKITKVGQGTVVLDGAAICGPGASLVVESGTVDLNADAGGGGANLSLLVAHGVVRLDADQHLDTLSIGPGGTVVLTGARRVVLNDLVMNGVDLGAAILVPEPATLSLLALGGWAAVARPRRRGAARP
jgi:autotransporter-associated beta strand protein